MMISFKQYSELDEDSREFLCWNEGVCISQRQERGNIYHLYQLGSFYIEIEYNIAFNTFQSFTAFESMEKLEPYLAVMNIDKII